MSDSSTELERHFLDRSWRIWGSAFVLGILAFGALLGVVIIPVVQGMSAGVDAYTAICRALGILPGSPARPQSPARTPRTPRLAGGLDARHSAGPGECRAGTRSRKGAGGMCRLSR